ncbi:hypothetical protein KIN20_009425 [Parelaphostrongylus tenuis]|uniref:Uncharacterized protein n=1 Tax=Parelaphostrongylus tenuis TaxID=148309 RepID=A0AAD5MRT2_PARTN|nr:hypothetical protein KIN20_009425 [Parelaphostrongylus tenuis]
MNETSHISRTPIRTITENGDGSPKYFERVNKLLSHDEQPHHDDISLTATGLDSLPTSSIEQHMPRTTNMDSLEKKANRSNSAHSAEFVTPIRTSSKSYNEYLIAALEDELSGRNGRLRPDARFDGSMAESSRQRCLEFIDKFSVFHVP